MKAYTCDSIIVCGDARFFKRTYFLPSDDSRLTLVSFFRIKILSHRKSSSFLRAYYTCYILYSQSISSKSRKKIKKIISNFVTFHFCFLLSALHKCCRNCKHFDCKLEWRVARINIGRNSQTNITCCPNFV